MLKLNGLMMGLNIKKDISLIRLEGEVRKDGQANRGAYPIMKFNIIYIMRTYVLIRGFWRPGLIMGFLLWPTISTPAAHAVERIRFSAGLKPSSFRSRLHCYCRLLLSDTMMFAQKSLNTQCLSPVCFLQKCMHVRRALAASQDFGTWRSNAAQPPSKIINRWFGRQPTLPT